jgi:hypothetical protein
MTIYKKQNKSNVSKTLRNHMLDKIRPEGRSLAPPFFLADKKEPTQNE